MNLRKSFYLTGNFVIYFGLFLLAPLIFYFFLDSNHVTFFDGDNLLQAIPFFASSLVTLLCGYGLRIASHNSEAMDKDLTRKDGFFLASLVWILAGVFGSLPYIFSSLDIYEFIGSPFHPIFQVNIFTNSFFESVSGITTTGASVLTPFPDVVEQHKLLIAWRSLTQWLGGIGIILLVLIVFPRISVGVMQIASDQEGTGPQRERMTPRIYQTGLILFYIYMALTLVLLCLLYFVGNMSLYDSIIHTFSTVSTGGFSSYPISIQYLNNLTVEVIIAVFIFLSGTSFAIYYFLIKGNYKKIFENSEFKAYILLNTFLIFFLVFLLYKYYDFSSLSDCFRFGSFQALSLSTGTGFTSFNFNDWSNHAKIVLLAVMILGGCSGSTTGGIKIMRVLIVFKRIYIEIKRRISPNVISTVKINGKAIDDDVVSGVFSFLFLYVLIIVISAVLLLVFESDVTSLSALSASISSIANVGPGFEQINPSSNYSFFSGQSKILLSFLMLFGRLELFTMIALLVPSFWRKY